MKKTLWNIWGVVLLLGLFLTGVLVPWAEAAEKTIKMASVNAFSGKAAAWGFSQDRGVKMAAEKVNSAGGIKMGQMSINGKFEATTTDTSRPRP